MSEQQERKWGSAVCSGCKKRFSFKLSAVKTYKLCPRCRRKSKIYNNKLRWAVNESKASRSNGDEGVSADGAS